MYQTYFKAIQDKFLLEEDVSEHTYRTFLENMLNSFLDKNLKRKIKIIHEPKQQGDKGRPDFKIITKEQLTIGFIETKKIGEDLDAILNTKQLEKYKKLSDNIILTDYLRFILIRNGEVIEDVPFLTQLLLKNKKYKIENSKSDVFANFLSNFFTSEPEPIITAKDLANKLADKATYLREFCFNIVSNENIHTRLHALMQAFQITLLPMIDAKKFADIYAQTLTYGLYISALNCDNPEKELNKKTAYDFLPKSMQLIKELFHLIEEFPEDIVWAVDEIISILKVTDFAQIQKEFAEYRQKSKGFSDPYIYFYEDFLFHYDKNQRKIRGVYYTPEPVVSFIVRSIELVLKNTFEIKDGFIGDNVTVLDFASGTGTFLLNVFDRAIEEAKKLGDDFVVKRIVNDKLLDNFYGFELLVAPYVVSHLKISEFLKERNYEIENNKRLNIFLTNTLSNKEPKPFDFMPSLSEEGIKANKIKNNDILVILGNPPYSGHSANVNDWISEIISDYYFVDGQSLGEKNPKWLQDDYVKFIRFAQWKMDKVERGIVGIISNHSYLDNPTFRGMRQSLMKTYDEIYILDLHGNSLKKETCPDGSKDENVFEIKQGVSIAIFVRKNSKPKNCKIYHSDLYGVKKAKYEECYANNIQSIKWKEAKPSSPYYLFVPRDERLLKKYEKGISIKDIFKINSVGIVTARDNFTIDFNKEKLWNKINEFVNLDDEEARIKYNLGKDVRDWKVSFAKKDLLDSGLRKGNIISISYRPFDTRYTYYTGKSRGFHCMPRKNIMINMQEENIALISVRQVILKEFAHSFISNNIIESCSISNNTREINYFYPLYIMSNGEERMFFGVREQEVPYGDNYTKSGLRKKENFNYDFRLFINKKYKQIKTPEQILGYIYAVLHSPTYRTKYINFLKIDFPKIPFTNDEAMFDELSQIGNELIQHHLLKKSYSESICHFAGDGDDFKVTKVEYTEGKVWINESRFFEIIPESIWNFHIGGYQVLDKWLKERKRHNLILSGDDIRHFLKIVNVIDITLKTMNRIDEKTKEWI